MRFGRSLTLLALTALAGCQDQAVVAPAGDAAGPSANAGFTDPRKGPVLTGYVADGDGRTARAIAYQVVNGIAIWDGDVPLGPASRIASTPEAALRRAGMPGPSMSLHASGSSAWANGTIPYVVEGTAPANLGPAMSQIASQVPGVKFVQRTTQSTYLRIYNHGAVGYHQYYGGSPVRSLGLDYYGLPNSKAILMHELGHVLGFQHEHQRCDRGSYIRLLDTNPYPSEFNTLCGSVPVGSYDRNSIMHYNSREFGRLHFTDLNGAEVQGYWGRTTLSSADVSSWKSLYPGGSTTPVTGTTGQTACTGGYCGPYNLRTGPGTGYAVSGSVNGGVSVTIVCQANGTSHTGPWGTTSLWNKLGGAHAGKWISDAFVYTGTSGMVAPPC